jgi:hypothetical protein
MRRKHRVLVEVTFDKRVTAKTAKEAVEFGLHSLSGHYFERDGTIEKIVVKEAERVIQAEINWKNRRLPADGEPGEP